MGAYVLTMEMWHQETVALIEAGRMQAYCSGDPAASIAWRLIGLFVCGLDGIYLLNMPEMMTLRLIIILINFLELFQSLLE